MNEICICGHAKSEHAQLNHGGYAYCCHQDEKPEAAFANGVAAVQCRCEEYRACLPWPDSVGNWWCDNPRIMVEVIEFEGGYMLDHNREMWTYPAWQQFLGPASFVKVNEQNPFTGATT